MKVTVRKPTEAEKAEMLNQPTWGCGVSEFDWYYDSQETFLLIEGDVTIEYDGGSAKVEPGDLAICPAGLSCVWKVVKPVRKHYKFGG